MLPPRQVAALADSPLGPSGVVLQRRDDGSASSSFIANGHNLHDQKVVHIVPDSSCGLTALDSCNDEEDGLSSLESTVGSSDNDEYDSDDDDDDDNLSAATNEEEEDLLVKRLVEYAFAGQKQRHHLLKRPYNYENATTPHASNKKPRPLLDHTSSHHHPFTPKNVPAVAATTSAVGLSKRISTSLSAPNLLLRPTSSRNQTCRTVPATPVLAPQEYLRSLHEKAGMPYQTIPALNVPNDFFVKSDGEYDLAIVQAVRSQDLEALRQLHAQGRSLQCANKFGESTVHTASRHGAAQVLALLFHEANASPRVVCDAGRTPLHDACWTAIPPTHGMEAVGVLLDACPDLLYVTDSRGWTPLAYVPREHWEAWNQYLTERGFEQLAARELFSH